MATKSQANSTTTRFYEDFQPSSNMVREEGVDTLVIHLSGFKKEQLRVQIDSNGNLKITGERQLEENRWSRFRKEIRVPKNCNTSEITAKFVGGLLYVKLPKKAGDAMEQEQPTETPEAAEKRSEQANNTANGKVGEICRPAMGGLGLRLKQKKMVIGVVVALAVAVALGNYAVYRLRSSTGGDEY